MLGLMMVSLLLLEANMLSLFSLSFSSLRRRSVWGVLGLSLLLWALAACGGESAAPEPTPVTYETYTDEFLGVTFQHPQGWVVGMNADELLELKSAADVALDENYTGGVIVQMMTLPSGALGDGPLAALEFLKEDMVAGVVSSGEEATVVQEPTAVTINDMPAAVTRIQAQQGSVDGTAEIYLIDGGEQTALVMLFFSQSEEAEQRAILDHFLNNFQIAQ
jgi:hypothetical protein